jgi:hypothetical protein
MIVMACMCGGVIELFIGIVTFGLLGACWKCIKKLCRCKSQNKECRCHDCKDQKEVL